MGQKVHPIGLRLGIGKTWSSRWYSEKDFGKLLEEDIKIRSFLKKRLYAAGISKIEIERAGDGLRVIIFSARPGMVIGRKGQEIEKLKKELRRLTSKELEIDIEDVKRAECDAQLVAEDVAQRLKKRVSFRRVIKRAVSSALRLGALGVKISVAGRLAGAEIARTEWYREGRIPLHTLRADIDYGFAEAHTTYGVIGVKTWVFKGEILK